MLIYARVKILTKTFYQFFLFRISFKLKNLFQNFFKKLKIPTSNLKKLFETPLRFCKLDFAKLRLILVLEALS